MVTAESNILAVYQYHQSAFSCKLLEHAVDPLVYHCQRLLILWILLIERKDCYFSYFLETLKPINLKKKGSPYLVSKQNKDTYTQNPKHFYVDVIEIYLK